MKFIYPFIFCLAFYQISYATDYYLSNLGNDANAGTSIEAAWKTIDQINKTSFKPGDKILFKGGHSFNGNISLSPDDRTSLTNPIHISSYGQGPATIIAGKAYGIFCHNVAGIEIKNLKIIGIGRLVNNNHGIYFLKDSLMPKLEYIVIDQVEISGFKNYGIAIGSTDTSKQGFRNCRITNVSCHDNGLGGISSWGFFSPNSKIWTHENFYIGNSKFFDNLGQPDKLDNHSGNGVVLGDVDGAIIEYCEAYNNGELCNFPGGGPVGLWAYESNKVLIQFNESHHNKTGAASVDGGGFDLDGGCTNSIMQYNYSHDNDGAGFLVGDYTGSRPTKNNTVRYNISENDGREHSYAGVFVYAGLDCKIYNNTIFNSPSSLGGDPKCIHVFGSQGTKAWNNLLISAGGATLLSSDNVSLNGNNYFSGEWDFKIYWGGKLYKNINEFRSGTGQEVLNGANTGMSLDPKRKKIKSTGSHHKAFNYMLSASSAMIDAGLNLLSLFGTDPGPTDYYKVAIPQNEKFDIGAYEYKSDEKK